MNNLIRRNCIDISGILELEDDKFVEQLYRVLLKREGDKGGIRSNLDALKHGVTRGEIILNMASSDEALIKNVTAVGLKDISYKTLMKFDDDMFVENVYLSILGRHIDESGYKNIGLMYGVGLLSKIEVVYYVRYSAEGIEKNVNVYGLKSAYKRFRVGQLGYRVPIIGRYYKSLRDVQLLKKGMQKLAMDFYNMYLGNGVSFGVATGSAQIYSNLEQRVLYLEKYSKEVHRVDMSQEVYDLYQYLCSHERIGK